MVTSSDPALALGFYTWTTASRPPASALVPGRAGFNTDYGIIEWWDGSSWKTSSVASSTFSPGTDITSQLQAVITSGTDTLITFPPGTFYLDQVNVTRAVTIQGSGATVFSPNTVTGTSNQSTGISIFNIQSDNVTFRDFSCSGSVPTNTQPTVNTVRAVNDVNVYPRIWFNCARISGDTGRSNTTIQHVNATGGIYFLNSICSVSTKISFCILNDLWDGGILLTACKQFLIMGNEFHNVRWSASAITVGSSSPQDVQGYYGEVIGNLFDNCCDLGGQENFDLNTSSFKGLLVEGNTFIADTLWVYYGDVATVVDATHFTLPHNVQNDTNSYLNYGSRRVQAIDNSGAGTAIYGSVTAAVFAAGITTITVSWDASNLTALSGTIFTYLDNSGGGMEVKTENINTLYNFWDGLVISGNFFKLAGTKHAISCTVRDALSGAKGRRILFTGNRIEYDDIPVSTVYGAVNSESWEAIEMIGNSFVNAYACFKCDANFGDLTSSNHLFQTNRVRNCRNGVIHHGDAMPNFSMLNNDMEVIDFAFWANSTCIHDDLKVAGNWITQTQDASSNGNNCPIYLADGTNISIHNNPLIMGNRWPITIGAVGSGTLSNISIRQNVIVTTSSSSSFAGVAIYRGDIFNLVENQMILDAAQGSWITPSGAPTNIFNRTNLGFATAAPTRAAKLGDYVDNSAPSAGGVDKWICTTAGGSGAATWKSVVISA